MRTITVYDPAMCCSSGVCGPDVQPRLPQFAGDLDWLKRQGIAVERLNLAREPERFLQDPPVKALLETEPEGSLPAIVVSGELKSQGRYPSRAELAAMAGVAMATDTGNLSPPTTATACCAKCDCC